MLLCLCALQLSWRAARRCGGATWVQCRRARRYRSHATRAARTTRRRRSRGTTCGRVGPLRRAPRPLRAPTPPASFPRRLLCLLPPPAREGTPLSGPAWSVVGKPGLERQTAETGSSQQRPLLRLQLRKAIGRSAPCRRSRLLHSAVWPARTTGPPSAAACRTRRSRRNRSTCPLCSPSLVCSAQFTARCFQFQCSQCPQCSQCKVLSVYIDWGSVLKLVRRALEAHADGAGGHQLNSGWGHRTTVHVRVRRAEPERGNSLVAPSRERLRSRHHVWRDRLVGVPVLLVFYSRSPVLRVFSSSRLLTAPPPNNLFYRLLWRIKIKTVFVFFTRTRTSNSVLCTGGGRVRRPPVAQRAGLPADALRFQRQCRLRARAPGDQHDARRALRPSGPPLYASCTVLCSVPAFTVQCNECPLSLWGCGSLTGDLALTDARRRLVYSNLCALNTGRGRN